MAVSTLSGVLNGRSAGHSSTFNAILDAFFPETKVAAVGRPTDPRDVERRKQHVARKNLTGLWEQASQRTRQQGKTRRKPPAEAISGDSASTAGSTALPADPGADFIRAVEEFVQQISGIRPDGFPGSPPAVADAAFAARAWEAVRQANERVKITCPAAATHAKTVWETVTHFYGVYLEWVEPEGDENPDSMDYLRGPEPAGPEDLKILGIRASETLQESLGAFRERWRELH
ncbi:hypothetical protein ACFRIB_19360 [Streptomyces mirabilis]|uniref:hypothetical protein n=1 Tax=Streptomyces mirabilis TaxID=68239 RepID=UPI00369DD2D1